jgi:esterase/lipase superfamily enzyme
MTNSRAVTTSFVFLTLLAFSSSLLHTTPVTSAQQREAQIQAQPQSTPAFGHIEISTNPGGYTIWIDGQSFGETTPTVQLIERPPGIHLIEIQFPEKQRWMRELKIVSGKTICITLAYRPTSQTNQTPTPPSSGDAEQERDGVLQFRQGNVSGTIADCGGMATSAASDDSPPIIVGGREGGGKIGAIPSLPLPQPSPSPLPMVMPSPPPTVMATPEEEPVTVGGTEPPSPRVMHSSPPPLVRSAPVSSSPQAGKKKEEDKKEDFTLVRVFYGTDRNRTGAQEAAKFYGAEHGPLELGTCEVSIPKSHQRGNLESPSLVHMEFSEDPKRHIVLRSIEPLDPEKFYERYRAGIDASSRDVFVFVHGYNVNFADAARRTAQFAYDLDFHGVPVLYSWPSQGALSGYVVDENNVMRTKTHLKQFLSDLAARSNGARIHLIAHSMGNRALTEALHDLALTNPTPLFSEVLLTAPDIDADYFRDEIAPAIQKIARRVTLYASSDDKALMASKKAHGFQRAGDSAPTIVVVPGIDTVDASGIDTSLLGLGHSYFAETNVVLNDIGLLLTTDKSPPERLLLEQLKGTDKYWKFSSAAAAALTTATTAALVPQGNQLPGATMLGVPAPGMTPGANLFSPRLVLLLAVLLLVGVVGAWLAIRFARRRAT